jgi:putative oxidoreductase
VGQEIGIMMSSLWGGLQQYEWVGMLIARVAVGCLFALSGGGKLFVRSRRDAMFRTLLNVGVPAPAITSVLVSAIECTFGILLVVGFLTPVSSLMLSGVMIVALATVNLPQVKATSVIGWLRSVLYLPEVLYLVILVWLFFAGAGWASLDFMIWGVV